MHSYGWSKDKADNRDRHFTATHTIASLPPYMDLRKLFPPVYDQSTLGSCTANSIAAVVASDLIKQKRPTFTPSRLFIYYNEREMEGTVNQDCGAEIRDGIKTINSVGVCDEKEWPYKVKQFATKPTPQCYTDAAKNKSVSYESVNQDLVSLQSCLAGWYGFCFGFSVYDSFESQDVVQRGVVPMPTDQDTLLGGHAVVCVGYNAGTKKVNDIPPHTFIVRNSWGSDWGLNGHCFMPFAYLTNPTLANDFWKITLLQ